MEAFQVRTATRSEFRNITGLVEAAVARAGAKHGIAFVFVPHTTAGITINENADPSVIHDMQEALERLAPWEQAFYRHTEGNSAAHIKASLVGSSVLVPIADGRLVFGQWQGIFFCEFDGPRTRMVQVQVIAD
jgi:secondary thiamine-phosphate synthase enzyme